MLLLLLLLLLGLSGNHATELLGYLGLGCGHSWLRRRLESEAELGLGACRRWPGGWRHLVADIRGTGVLPVPISIYIAVPARSSNGIVVGMRLLRAGGMLMILIVCLVERHTVGILHENVVAFVVWRMLAMVMQMLLFVVPLVRRSRGRAGKGVGTLRPLPRVPLATPVSTMITSLLPILVTTGITVCWPRWHILRVLATRASWGIIWRRVVGLAV